MFLITVVVTAILADQPAARLLLLTPSMVLDGSGVWQPLSANFIYPEGRVTMVIGTGVIQWFVGSELEGFWGSRKYLILVIGCGIAGYLASVLIGLAVPVVSATPVGGATGMDLAALTAFGVVFGKRPMRGIPLTARSVAMIVIAISIVAPLLRGAPWPVVIPWLVAVGGALLVTTQPWRRLRDSGKLGGSKSKRKRSHLKVVGPDHKLLN